MEFLSSFTVLILIVCKKNTVYVETTTFDHVYAAKARLILKLTYTELVKSCKKKSKFDLNLQMPQKSCCIKINSLVSYIRNSKAWTLSY